MTGFSASPFAMIRSVSFVDVSPSTVIILKVSLITSLSAFCSNAFSIARSVVRKPSIVHILGWIMPEPLLIPPRVTVLPPISKVTAISLFTVSVVMIALDAAVPASVVCASVLLIFATPFTSFSTGSCIPITPVDATATLSAGTFRSFSTALAVASHASQPS